MSLKTSFHAEKVQCAFWGNHLIIALSTSRDLFKCGSIWKSITDERDYFQVYEELISILKLIDHFKLDQKIGL